VSDAVPPQLPLLPPPPPLPPVPEGYEPPPTIGWGLGDIFWGLLVYLVGGVAVSIVLLATGAVDTASVADTGTVGELSLGAIALSILGSWVAFIGWPLVATYRKGQRSLAKDFGLEIRWIDLAWGLLGGVGAFGVSVALGIVWKVATGDDPPSNGGFLPEHPGLAVGLALWLMVAVGTPIAEELFFRGLALRAIGRRWNLPVAVIASSLLFGAMHFEGGDGVGAGFFILAVTTGYGLILSLLVVRAGGRLGSSIIAHSLINTVAIVSLFAT
jgi:membrane protease YdiL (CAAX protease family)